MKLGPYRFRAGWVPTVVTLALLALLVSLGRWQLDRAVEKQSLVERFDHRAERPTLDLTAEAGVLAGPVEGLRHQRVTVRGRFTGDRQFLLDNRTHHGIAGYHVLTPLRIEGSDRALIVNRGWLPVGASRDVLPELTVATDMVELRGVITIPPADVPLLGESGYAQITWPRRVQRIELATMSDATGLSLLGFVVRLDPDAAGGYTRDWRAHPGIGPDRHRAYAFQWFSLALALLVIYLVVNTSRESGTRCDSDPTRS